MEAGQRGIGDRRKDAKTTTQEEEQTPRNTQTHKHTHTGAQGVRVATKQIKKEKIAKKGPLGKGNTRKHEEDAKKTEKRGDGVKVAEVSHSSPNNYHASNSRRAILRRWAKKIRLQEENDPAVRYQRPLEEYPYVYRSALAIITRPLLR